MGMLLLVQALHDFSQKFPACFVTREQNNIVVAHQGQLSSTKVDQGEKAWRVRTAAAASVFYMQNPSRQFEAITSSIIA